MPPKAKDAALVVLVIANVILLCAVLAHVFQLPRAQAQAVEAPVAQRYLAVSGQIQSGFDALYVLDAGQQRLYTWSPSRSTTPSNMVLRDMRDLRQDFARQPTPAVPPRPR